MASTPLSSPKLPPQRSELDLEDKERCLSNRSSDGLGLESNRAPEPPDALPAEQDFEWVSGVKLLNIMTAVTLVCFLVLLDSAIIVTAVPRITSDFHSLPDVGWYGSAYQLARYVV